MAEERSGQCLCGAVQFRAAGLRDIWLCHCRQCRYVTGHFMAACRTESDRLSVNGEVSWTQHSNGSEIGRCARCASPLFWRAPDAATISVIAGSLDDTSGLEVPGHIFTSEKGGYYAISDGLPQWPARPEGGY